jgi:hypothetical protein
MRPARISMMTLLIAGAWSAIARDGSAAPPTPPVPGKSPPMSRVDDARVLRRFASGGIRSVVLRAEAAGKAKVRVVPGRPEITVTARPAGGAVGYHPADPNWRETPASEWGLDFAAARFGPSLVVSSKSEIRYIHHYYHLEDIEIEVPPEVAVIKEDRELTGYGAPDLSPPGGSKGGSPARP